MSALVLIVSSESMVVERWRESIIMPSTRVRYYLIRFDQVRINSPRTDPVKRLLRAASRSFVPLRLISIPPFP